MNDPGMITLSAGIAATLWWFIEAYPGWTHPSSFRRGKSIAGSILFLPIFWTLILVGVPIWVLAVVFAGGLVITAALGDRE